MAGTRPAMTGQRDEKNERPEYPDPAQGVRSPHPRCVDARDREHGQAHRCAGSWTDSAADENREIHGQPLAACRQEEPRTVRDAHAQAPPGHRRSDPADGGRADEARPRRGRRCRDQALGPGIGSAMRSGVVAQKVGMTRVFTEAGEHVPVTVLRLAQCQVVAHRTKDKNGYVALQIGSGARRTNNMSKADRGYFGKQNVEPKRKLAEFRVSEDALIPVGAEITADHFIPGQFVDICGITIGKGFAGGMKRWNFAGLRASHGVSISHRSIGGTGGRQDPGKTFKNKKMPGHLGVDRVTTLNLKVVQTDVERGLILVEGSVPGAKSGWVTVRDAVKKMLPKEAPKPGKFRVSEAAEAKTGKTNAKTEDQPEEQPEAKTAPAKAEQAKAQPAAAEQAAKPAKQAAKPDKSAKAADKPSAAAKTKEGE